MNEEEKFFAWLDGELSGPKALAMEAKVDSDPELRRLADEHRAFQSHLKGAFDEIAAAPVPGGLVAAALGDKPKVVDFAAHRDARDARRFGGVPQWAAVAATLVFGIMVGTLLPDEGARPVEVEGGTLYAAGAIDQALDTQLASAPSGDVRIGLTFRDSEGSVCRTFTGAEAEGLACRSDGRWKLRGLFPVQDGQQSDYRMAAGMDPALAALLDSTMAGEPFDSAQESAAAQRGWQ